MAFEVKYTALSEDDLDDIHGWLLSMARVACAGFKGCVKRWERLLTCRTPSMLARENGSVPFDMRQLLYGRKPHVYRTLFTVEGIEVSLFAFVTVAASLWLRIEKSATHLKRPKVFIRVNPGAFFL